MPEGILERVAPVSEDAALHAFLTELRRHGAVPVSVNGAVKGLVALEDAAHRELPLATKAGRLLSNAPYVAPDADARDAARLLLDARTRAMIAVAGKRYRGLITERSLLHAAPFTRAPLADIRVSAVASAPFTVEPDTAIAAARRVMRARRYGQMPVVDGGTLVGLVEWASFLAIDRPTRLRGRKDAGIVESLQESSLPVSTVMNTAPLVVEPDARVREVAARMARARARAALLVEGRAPVGIVTCEDLLELLVSRPTEEGVYIQITGQEGLDPFEREHLHDEVERAAGKIGSIFGGTEHLYVHLKRYQNQGAGRTKWSVRTRIQTPVGTFHSRANGFSLPIAMDQATQRLARLVKTSHDRHIKTVHAVPRPADQRRRPRAHPLEPFRTR